MTTKMTATADAAKVREQCIVQANDFVKAAEILAKAGEFPHIVYHLSLLSLEEIGKGNMVVARAIAGDLRDSAWMDKALDSHTRKLEWALWSPITRIDPKESEEAREFAHHAHELRLASLYVNTLAGIDDLPSKQLGSGPNKRIPRTTSL